MNLTELVASTLLSRDCGIRVVVPPAVPYHCCEVHLVAEHSFHNLTGCYPTNVRAEFWVVIELSCRLAKPGARGGRRREWAVEALHISQDKSRDKEAHS
jgi:hypothetical protein